jgi:hypothetical protein
MSPPNIELPKDWGDLPQIVGGSQQLSLAAMVVTQIATGNDFLRQHQIATPVPLILGAIPNHARVAFGEPKTGLPIDLVVVWTIGDFRLPTSCSYYYDRDSPWYNTFYGAYGIRAHKHDGLPWGFKDPQGRTPDLDEVLKVPECDYNVLTAGELGCPPAKRVFRVLNKTPPATWKSWFFSEVTAEVPSGLHDLPDAVNANPLYYIVFGFPDSDLSKKASSYEPVRMWGQMFFRLADVADKITLCWGGMAPDTPDGRKLAQSIIDAMKLLY